MGLLKNFLLFCVMFAWGVVALNYVGLVDVNVGGDFTKIFTSSPDAQIVNETGTQVTGELIVVNGTVIPQCEWTLRPEIDPISKLVTCVPAVSLATDCMWPDGEAYKNNSKKVFYKVAEKTTATPRPTCESIEKTCLNGNFVPSDTQDLHDKKEYAFLECMTIDRTDDSLKTCKSEDGLEYPAGSKRIQFFSTEVTADADCRHIEAFCNAEWNWISNFPTHINAKCDFKWSFSSQFLKANIDKIFDTSWSLNPAALGTLEQDSSKKWCRLPRWESILHGEKRLSFRDKVVRFDEECFSRTHTCVDGILEFVEPYPYATCTIEWPSNCTITGTDVIVLHGSSKLLYKKWALTNGVFGCEEQVRSCSDGTLDGSDEYKFTSCNKPTSTTAVSNAPYRCPNPYVWESTVLEQWRSWVGYYNKTVSWNESCDGEVNGRVNKVALSCAYGTIQPIGNTTKVRRTCTQGVAKSCISPWWVSVANGESIVVYKNNTVWYSETCESEIRVCDDWDLRWTYQYEKCTVARAWDCTAPWWGTVSHGVTIQAYQQELVPYSANCNAQNRTCHNGVLDGTFVFRSCVKEAPKDCTYNGTLVKHGQTIARYREPQVVGAVADGTDQCVRYTATCNDGIMQGTLMSHPEATYVQCTTTIPNNGSN